MGFKYNVSNWCVEHANTLIQFTKAAPKPILFSLSVLLIIFWLAGKKLSRFAKPEYPKTSTVIRQVGSFVSLVGFVATVVFLTYSLVIFILAMLGFYLSDQFQGYSFFEMLSNTSSQIWIVATGSLEAIISGSGIGLILSVYLTYYQIPDWERGEGLDDVEKTVKRFKKLNIFDSLRYLDYKKGCFLGKGAKGSPIYIPWAKLRETHMQILGTTGSGKGVVMSLIASQCTMQKEGIVWFDPKFDRYAPKIISLAAREADKKFHFINLNPDQPAQFNLIAGCNQHEIEEMLVAGFDLRNKGSDGDFYRGKDEDAAILAAKISINEKASSIPELLEVCSQITEITDQENFWRMFKKLASLPVVNTSGGVDLQAAILNGDVIYIVGSCDNERVKMLQKMLLVRVMQIIKKRDRAVKNKSICVVLDEFKYLLSSTALSALGVVRDFDAHFILAHQSLGDLEECAGVSPASAYGAVVDNTSIKILYRINDAIHAEKMAKLSGMKRTFVESTSKNDDETKANSASWREAQKYFVSPDLITHLPIPSDRAKQASVGVLFGIGNAKLLHVGRIDIQAQMPKPVVVCAYQSDDPSALTATDLI